MDRPCIIGGMTIDGQHNKMI
jgi:hypothetical protein